MREVEQYGGSAQEAANSRSLYNFLRNGAGKKLVIERGKGVVRLRFDDTTENNDGRAHHWKQ